MKKENLPKLINDTRTTSKYYEIIIDSLSLVKRNDLLSNILYTEEIKENNIEFKLIIPTLSDPIIYRKVLPITKGEHTALVKNHIEIARKDILRTLIYRGTTAIYMDCVDKILYSEQVKLNKLRYNLTGEE